MPKAPERSQFVVVLDPGHGGVDSGSVTRYRDPIRDQQHRIAEKDVVLRLAQYTAAILEDPKFWEPLGHPVKVTLTRKGDAAPTLDERARISRTAGADFFVSIHANAENTGQARGIETYFLDNASKETYSHHETLLEREQKRSEEASQRDDTLSLLLRSIETDATVLPSKKAAQFIQESVIEQVEKDGFNIKDRGTRSALLQVLLDVRTPGVLFEGPFLSNPMDRRLLTDEKALKAMAKGLATGILRYLAVHD